MILPECNQSKLSSSVISEFYGLQKQKAQRNEKNFESCKNMGHDYYPAAGSRKQRFRVGTMENVLGVCETADSLYYVAKDEAGTHLFCNGKIVTKKIVEQNGAETVEKEEEVVKELSDTEKQMVMMGA